MEQHRAKPSCNACHGVMDPLGFALENFDAIGAWRTRDCEAGSAIDASGVLVDGTRVSSPRELTDALVRRPEQFVQTFAEKLLTYALGRGLEAQDMPTVRAIVRERRARPVPVLVSRPRRRDNTPFQMSRRSAGPTPHRPQGATDMFIFKKSLSRRTFLRGAGGDGPPCSTPWRRPRRRWADAGGAQARLGFLYLPHGAIMNEWTPAAEGASFELTPILKPLQAFKKQLTIISGLENKPASRRPCTR